MCAERRSKPRTENRTASAVFGCPSRSIRDGEAEPNLSQHLREEVRRLVNLARELAEQMGADPDDAELIENQVLGAAAAVEAALGAHETADDGPRGANGEEDEE